MQDQYDLWKAQRELLLSIKLNNLNEELVARSRKGELYKEKHLSDGYSYGMSFSNQYYVVKFNSQIIAFCDKLDINEVVNNHKAGIAKY